jgi:hypothetical protein
MDDRIQRVLDQELPRAALSSDEAQRLAATEKMIADVLRSLPRLENDLTPAVMQRIDQAEEAHLVPHTPPPLNGLRQALRWFWEPRPTSISWRPAYAVALIALLAIMPALRRTAPSSAAETNARQVLVQFRLDAPNASAVRLAGDFTRWQPLYPMTRTESGIWTVVVPIEPGVHDYAFVVDGETWTPDPMAPAVADGFGGLNSRLAVLSPDQPKAM